MCIHSCEFFFAFIGVHLNVVQHWWENNPKTYVSIMREIDG